MKEGKEKKRVDEEKNNDKLCRKKERKGRNVGKR